MPSTYSPGSATGCTWSLARWRARLKSHKSTRSLSAGRGCRLPPLAAPARPHPARPPHARGAPLGGQPRAPLLKQVGVFSVEQLSMKYHLGRHAHPDMASLQRRIDSFPPDWTTISGSAGSATSLAEAGFFYSCRYHHSSSSSSSSPSSLASAAPSSSSS